MQLSLVQETLSLIQLRLDVLRSSILCSLTTYFLGAIVKPNSGSLTMVELLGTYEDSGKLMQCQKASLASLVAQAQAPMVVEPRQGALHHPARAAQARSMGVVLGPRQLRPHTALARGANVLVPTIAPVALKDPRTESRPAPGPPDGRNGVQQLYGDLAVRHVGGRRDEGERQAARVDDQMPLYALLAAIRGVWPRVSPPKTARTEALSMTARERSTCSCLPKALSTRCQTAGQTPAVVHWRSRRQQVEPSPQPSSAGRSFQAQPVRSTKTMPTRHLRSGTRGRPPLGLGGSAGSSGAISFQSSSLTHWRAIDSPLLEGLRPDHRT